MAVVVACRTASVILSAVEMASSIVASSGPLLLLLLLPSGRLFSNSFTAYSFSNFIAKLIWSSRKWDAAWVWDWGLRYSVTSRRRCNALHPDCSLAASIIVPFNSCSTSWGVVVALLSRCWYPPLLPLLPPPPPEVVVVGGDRGGIGEPRCIDPLPPPKCGSGEPPPPPPP